MGSWLDLKWPERQLFGDDLLRLGPDADLVSVVVRESACPLAAIMYTTRSASSRDVLGHPNLEELPNSFGSHGSRVDHPGVILARERALVRRVVQRVRPRLRGVDLPRDSIHDAGRGDIVAEPRLNRLVDIQDVGVVVHGPRVQDRGVGAGLGDGTRPVAGEGLVDGRGSGAALEPETERRGLGRVARLEEPEEELLLVLLEVG